VRLFVTVGPGGAADTLSRNLVGGFSQFTNGQPLLVENRAGAGGTIAAAAVAREKPDGYTLFLAEVGPNACRTRSASFPTTRIPPSRPFVHLANLPAVVLIRANLPYKTLAEFVAAAKQQRASSTMPPRESATGRTCTWPISTAAPASTRSTLRTSPAPKC